jgi:hypothetical protein
VCFVQWLPSVNNSISISTSATSAAKSGVHSNTATTATATT